MKVVSNTSPLTNLAAIGQFDLLRKLYCEISIPDGVWDELNAFGKAWPGSREVAEADWVNRYTVRNQLWVSTLRSDLDRGESESIVLASELEADMILLDEKYGRNAALRIKLKPLGVIATPKIRKLVLRFFHHRNRNFVVGFLFHHPPVQNEIKLVFQHANFHP